MTEHIRKEFEAWYAKSKYVLQTDDNGYYGQTATNWDMWQAASARDGWQDIVTAPKDGTAVLLYYDDMCIVGVYADHWQEENTQKRWRCKWDMDWFRDEPTHWQPLPAPPKRDLMQDDKGEI